MNFIKIFLISILFSQIANSQNSTQSEFAAVDKKVLQIPLEMTRSTDQIASYIASNFSSDKDKTRAAFVWVSTNISYDVQNMYAVNLYEKEEDKIIKTLQTRKGICSNYANLFAEICTKVGIKAYVVGGYTKQKTTIDLLSHAWTAANIDGKWFLFDPTWASGYVSGGKFTKKLNNTFFKVNPETFIKKHMPFDYLWQLLEYPITNQEFYDGKIQQNKTKPKFNFKEELTIYDNQTEVDQLRASAARVEKNGVINALIFDQLKYLKLQAETTQQNIVVSKFNEASAAYNDGIYAYNDFINYRNKQFKPQLADNTIQEMIDNASGNIQKAKSIIAEIPNADASTTVLIKQLSRAIDDASSNLAEQQDWLKIYFNKGKLARKSMFFERKASLFGIPLN